MAPINEDIKQRAEAVFGENRQEPVTERAKQETRQRVVLFFSDSIKPRARCVSRKSRSITAVAGI